MRDLLRLRPDVKVVLMSAALHADLFVSYFGGCPRLHIPGFTYPVTEYFLEDVLRHTKHPSFKSIPASKKEEALEEFDGDNNKGLIQVLRQICGILICSGHQRHVAQPPE